MMSSCLPFVFIYLMIAFVSSCDDGCTEYPVFTPSRLVVKYTDPAKAACVPCQKNCDEDASGLEKSVGELTKNGSTVLWTVDRLTEWDIFIQCYYNADDGKQCCSNLTLTVYQPPESVSISFVNHTGPMFEHQQYSLQCSVHKVAPVQHLTVTFYRGHTTLGRLQSNSAEKEPVNEIFTLTIDTSREDNGAQYWCEAKLELGPDGPQRPPVVTSEKLSATVYYVPEITDSKPNPVQITVTEGDTLDLDCSSVGNPTPTYNWTHLSNRSFSYDGSVFTINTVGFQDKGQYTCNVSNAAGTVIKEFHVNVRANPLIWIIIGACVAAVLFITGFVVCFHYYKQNRKGSYNLKDVFRFPAKHIALPLVQQNCDNA